MSPSSWRRYRRILVGSVWRELMLTGLFALTGVAIVVQLWELPKPKITPIPTAPHQFTMPKEMQVQYPQKPVFYAWADPHVWMLRHDYQNGTWDWLERTMFPRKVLWENLKEPSKKKK